MAKPDLDDGYLRIAHELFAALACAGFNKWEMVVLREVFDQIYGPRKATVATLSPTGIAARVGTYKESIVRAIRTLCGSGVLSKTAEGEYRFIKDYEGWRDGEKRRCSPSELAYCAGAKRIKASKTNGNNGAPTHKRNVGTTALPAGNNGAPVREQMRSPWGTTALPHGNNGAPETLIGTRARSGEGEELGEEERSAAPRPREPEFPEPDGFWMAMTGPYRMPEETAREAWSLVWKAWGDERLCGEFYQHQHFHKPESWLEAIRETRRRNVTPNRISYVEKIAADYDANGIPEHKPAVGSPNGKGPTHTHPRFRDGTEQDRETAMRKLRERRERRAN